MITDQDTNFVFFSEHLYNLSCWEYIRRSLSSSCINYALLPFTKDFWVRDYMPIQIRSNRFIQYIYNPDYLQNDKKHITDPSHCCKYLHQTPIYTDIVLDGGNIIKCGDSVIMTDKIFMENPNYKRTTLIDKLEDLFQFEIVLIPWDKEEPFGHADGMVRYIDTNRVLINNYYNFDKYFRQKIIKSLSPKFEIHELHYNVKHLSEYSWAYINFLMVKNIIFIPYMEADEDSQAYLQLEEIYHTSILSINVRDLVLQGGALNCVSWNVKIEN